MTPYEKLCSTHDEISLLSTTCATLGWDQETNLPTKALPFRARQLSYFSGKIHGMVTSDEYGSTLADAEQAASDCATVQANIREWRHSYDRATKLPQELIERQSTITSMAKAAWAEAREKNEFNTFAPHLTKLLDLAREKAELWGYDDEPYDALLGAYERGAKTSDVSTIFDGCRDLLIQTAADAVAKSEANPAREMTGEFCEEQQKVLNREIAESIGFDFGAGRIDTTTHPFCSGNAPYDTRLTTRYYKNTFLPSLFGVMHETGHGMYEQGLNKDEYGRPAGRSVSLGIHESQSLLWEGHVGRSRAFWTKWLPRVQELFPQMADWSLEDIIGHINTAKYSFIRVDADEATYDLHILLRFDLERRMLNKEIAVEDIPAAWNESFQKMFGITPPTDTEGCLQDIHWSMGGIGYFSTYSLGNFNASQLFHHAKKDEAIATAFDNADYKPLLDWMRTNVHSKGSTLLPQDLMKAATGEGTNPTYHMAHLKRRFL